MKKSRIFSALMAVPLVLGLFPAGAALGVADTASPAQSMEGQKGEAVPGELIVRVKEGKRSKGFATKSGVAIRTVKAKEQTMLLKVPEDQTEAVAKELQSDPDVAYVEPNYIYRKQGEATVINDPDFSQQWGMPAVEATKAWELLDQWQGKKKEVVVAVVDTGIDAAHPDLQGRVLPGYNTIDDKPDGHDDNEHGTHVAGIIGAVPGNGIGVAGLVGNMPVKLLPIKVLNSNGSGTSLSVAAGIEKATEMGADVINMSLGGNGYSRLMHDAIKKANDKGVLVVVAAGNSSRNTIDYYPAGYSEVVTVASVNQQLQSSSFSNYGSEVDIAAPGEEVLSTVPGGKYEKFDGTSMATPFVSAAAAVLKSIHPDWSNEEVRAALLASAKDIDSKGFDTRTGNGLLQLAQAVSDPAGKPLRAISPAYGAQVWGKVEFDIEVHDSSIDYVNISTESGKKLGMVRVEKGRVKFVWDASGEKQGKTPILIQGLTSNAGKVGEPEKLLVNVIGNQAGGVAVSVLPPPGKSAIGTQIMVARSGDYQTVYSTHLDQQQAAYLPASMIQPDEKYLLIAQYLDDTGASQYLQYRVIDSKTTSVAFDFRKTKPIDIGLVNGSKSVDIEEASVYISPVFDQYVSDEFDIGTLEAKLGKGKSSSPYLPPGKYKVRAVGVTKDNDVFQLQEVVTLTAASNQVRLDLAKAKQLQFVRANWMSGLSISAGFEAFYPMKEGNRLYTSGDGDMSIRLMAEQKVDGKVWLYTFGARMKNIKDEVVRLDSVVVKAAIEDEEEEKPADKERIYKKGDRVWARSKIVLAGVFDEHETGWVNESEWAAIKDRSYLVYDEKKKHLRLVPKPEGLITEKVEKEPSIHWFNPQLFLLNQQGSEVARAVDERWFTIPNKAEITDGKYSLLADYAEIPLPLPEKRVKIADLTIADGTASTVGIRVLGPEGKDLDEIELTIFDETGKVIEELYYWKGFDEKIMEAEHLQVGKTYQFWLIGSTVDNQSIVLDRKVTVDRSNFDWNPWQGQSAPLKVAIPDSIKDAGIAIVKKEEDYSRRVYLSGSAGFVWIDPGTYKFDIRDIVSERKYWLFEQKEITESTKELPIEPNFDDMLKITVKGDISNDQFWQVGAKPKNDRFYTLFAFKDKDSQVYLSKGEYDFTLILNQSDEGKTTFMHTDAKPKATADGFEMELGHQFTASLKQKAEQYSAGEEALVDVVVADELGNRVTDFAVYTKDPDSLIDRNIRLQEEDGKFSLVEYDEKKRELQPISKQGVRPRLVVQKDETTVAESKQEENWAEASVKLPDTLEPGIYTLLWSVKLPFELEAKGTLTVGEKKEQTEENGKKKKKRSKKNSDQTEE